MGFMSKMLVKGATKATVGAAKKWTTSKFTDLAVKSISNMLGLSDTRIGKILERGIPGMIFAGAEDPSITDRLFGDMKDRKKDRDKKKKRGREESSHHFFDIFGNVGRRLVKSISHDTGESEENVSGVLGMFLPTFETVLDEEKPEDAGMLHGIFKKEVEEVEKESPGLAKRALNMIF
jgi:hypothetical protein